MFRLGQVGNYRRLGEVAGVSSGHIHHLISGKRSPSAESLKSLGIRKIQPPAIYELVEPGEQDFPLGLLQEIQKDTMEARKGRIENEG